MKTINKLFYLLGFCLIMSSVLMFSSCGDDDVEGCTDPAADNYNPEATMSSGDCTYSGCTDPAAENYNAQATNDDGSCEYARDKFLGSYFGSLACPGLLSIISNDSISFTIEEGLDADKVEEVIVNLEVAGVPIALPATVAGDVLTVQADLQGVPVNFGGVSVPADITGTGDAMLDASGDNISADLNLTVTIPSLGFTETQTCTLLGARQ